MPDLKSLSKMTVTVNGVERPMTQREQWLFSGFLFPFMSRVIAKKLRKKYPTAGNAEIAAIIRADLGEQADPLALRLADKILNRLPPAAGAPRWALLNEAQASPSAWVLLLANLIPAWGVLMQGWEVLPLVLLFWLENVFIGVLNAAQMQSVDLGDAGAWGTKLFLVRFFCFQYGMFTMIHGIFVFALFGGESYRLAGPVQAGRR